METVQLCAKAALTELVAALLKRAYDAYSKGQHTISSTEDIRKALAIAEVIPKI